MCSMIYRVEATIRDFVMMMGSEMFTARRRNSKDLVEEEDEDVTSKGLSWLPDSMSMDWTDEKHSLYLNSLEALFVKQLYNHKSNYQLKVHQSGCWKKNNFGRARSHRDIDPRTHILVESQRVRRFRSTVDHGDVKLPILQGNGFDSSEAMHSGGQRTTPFGVLKTSKKLHARYHRPCHEDPVILDLEISDQNFVDENHEKNQLSRQCSRKRMKI